MAWWVIVLVVWVVVSFTAAGVVALLSLGGRPVGAGVGQRRSTGLRAPGRGRSVAAGGPPVRPVGPRGHRIPGAARRHRRR